MLFLKLKPWGVLKTLEYQWHLICYHCRGSLTPTVSRMRHLTYFSVKALIH